MRGRRANGLERLFAFLFFVFAVCRLVFPSGAAEAAPYPRPATIEEGGTIDASPRPSVEKGVSLLDPGRDPESEERRRLRPVGPWGAWAFFGAVLAFAGLAWLSHKRKRRVVGGVFLGFASVFLVLLFVEIVLRLSLGLWAMHVKIRSNCYYDNPRGYFLPSAMAGHPEIGAFCVDELSGAWAECETRSEDDGRRRILALGDSFTDGVGVFRRDAWPRALESMLSDGGEDPKVRVVNCGRADLDTARLASRLEMALSLHYPDIVIYAYVLNDTPPDVFPGKGRPADVSFQVEDRFSYQARLSEDAFWGPPMAQSALVRFFAERFMRRRIEAATVAMYRRTYADPPSASLTETLDRTAVMRDRCRSAHARFLVAIFPMMYELENYPFRAAHALMARELEARGVKVLDLLEVFEGRDSARLQVHPTDFHPNEIAHALAAEAILKTLRASGWLSEEETGGNR